MLRYGVQRHGHYCVGVHARQLRARCRRCDPVLSATASLADVPLKAQRLQRMAARRFRWERLGF